MNDYGISDLLIDLKNEKIILHQSWLNVDPKSKTADIINGQGMELNKIINLIERKFNLTQYV